MKPINHAGHSWDNNLSLREKAHQHESLARVFDFPPPHPYGFATEVKGDIRRARKSADVVRTKGSPTEQP
jgi:hypothetical protein